MDMDMDLDMDTNMDMDMDNLIGHIQKNCERWKHEDFNNNKKSSIR
jgi:hypothetical protein